MEIKSNGRGIVSALVCLFQGPRLDAQSDGYKASAVVHRAYRRQAAGKAQLYFTHPRSNPIQENCEGKGQAAEKLEQRQIRRSGAIEGQEVRIRTLLNIVLGHGQQPFRTLDATVSGQDEMHRSDRYK